MPRYKLIIFDFDDTIGHLTIRWTDVKKELVEWAEKNGVEIIKEFSDAGRSGQPAGVLVRERVERG